MEKWKWNYVGGDENKFFSLKNRNAMLNDWKMNGMDVNNLEHHNKILEKTKILYDGCNKMKGYLDTNRAQELTSEERELRKR